MVTYRLRHVTPKAAVRHYGRLS